MANLAALYFHTTKNTKPSQITARLRIKLRKGNSLGVAVGGNTNDVQPIISMNELDFDPVFLARFSVEKLMENKVSFLHSDKDIDWKKDWEFNDKSTLWNFNLHYFEYLLPLVKAYLDSEDTKYLDKTIEIITGWIEANPVGKSPAWRSYTIALRIVTWIIYYGYVCEIIPEEFREKLLVSLHCQYEYLSKHLEKDILGNHYFEDLKGLLMASLFFKDEAVFQKVIVDFKAECKEEVLPDGMHFELSPMYHKIVFEGILRVASALREVGKKDMGIEGYLQPMLDVAYSFEDGLERIPLFNDGGNNVAKSLDTLVATAKSFFNLEPQFRGQLAVSGFYIFTQEANGHKWKLVVDAGQPGPKYIPGHAHCDAMSFELYRDGKPVVVNCGTYAYQCEERKFFRSTAAHNTVMIEGVEQSECWGAFRLAKRSSTKVVYIDEYSIYMEMTDQRGAQIKRQITFSDNLIITDKTDGHRIQAYLHFLNRPEERDGVLYCDGLKIHCGDGATLKIENQKYAEDYGKMSDVFAVKLTGSPIISVQIGMKGSE